MTIQLNKTTPSINKVHEIIQQTLGSKYKCDLIDDRWTLNFSTNLESRRCVLVKKSGSVGICVVVNPKKNEIDVDGVVPNQILDKVVFKTYISRMFLISSWKKMENEVAGVLQANIA